MAYGVKYELFFSDVERRRLKIEILEKGYTGDTSPIIGTGKPAIIEWDADDDVYAPIIGSRCKLSFFVTDSVQYDEFYKSDERQYKVKILYYNSYGGDIDDEDGVWNFMDVTWDATLGTGFYHQPIWEGFLVVDRYQEAILTPPYELNLEAIDGLGTLQGFDAPVSTTTTSNTENLFYYLKEILKLTGHEFDIYIANDIRKATSPADDETIFHDIEINEYGLFTPNMTLRNAKEVLEQLMKITNSRIFQSYGRWYVVSNSNLIDNTINLSTAAPSGDDATDDPDPPAPGAVYTQPNISISGQNPMYEGTSYFLSVQNSGTIPVSYEWTLPDYTTFTTTSPQYSLGIVNVNDDDGDTYSVEATDSNGQTDTASFTLNVDTRPVVTNPNPPQDETDDTSYIFKINALNSVTGAYVSPLTGTVEYPAGNVGESFTMQFNIVSTAGEFTSASQVSSATITSNTGTYTVTKALVGDFVRVTVTGNLPSGGGTENLILVGASEVQQFTTTYTRAGTVQNSSFSLNPTTLSATGGEGKQYEMTITYTAATDYEWRGPQDLTILQSSRVPSDLNNTVTVTKTSDTTLVVKITGAQGIQDQSATFTISGTSVYAADATTVTIDPSGLTSVTSGGGYIDVKISGADGKYSIVTSYLGTSTGWITLDKQLGNPTTTDLRVYFDPNNTDSQRRGAVQFKAYASNTVLATLTLNQPSNIQGG